MCLKKVPTFELSVTLSNLNRFLQFLLRSKAYEICYKTHATIPISPYVNYYTTLEKVHFLQISSRYERKCKQILIFSVFRIWSLSAYRLRIKFSISLFFYLFIIVINLWHPKFVTADLIAVFDNKQHCIQWQGQNFHKTFVFKEVDSKEVDIRIFWKKLDKTWC